MWNTSIARILWDITLPDQVTLPDEEIKPYEEVKAFFCLKGGKSRGFDEINYEIVKQNFNTLLVPLKCIFDLSFKSGTLSEKMNIEQAKPVFKSGDRLKLQ